MEISHNAGRRISQKILLGVQETDRTHNKKTASLSRRSRKIAFRFPSESKNPALRANAEQPDTERDARVGKIQQSVEGAPTPSTGKRSRTP